MASTELRGMQPGRQIPQHAGCLCTPPLPQYRPSRVLQAVKQQASSQTGRRHQQRQHSGGQICAAKAAKAEVEVIQPGADEASEASEPAEAGPEYAEDTEPELRPVESQLEQLEDGRMRVTIKVPQHTVNLMYDKAIQARTVYRVSLGLLLNAHCIRSSLKGCNLNGRTHPVDYISAARVHHYAGAGGA